MNRKQRRATSKVVAEQPNAIAANTSVGLAEQMFIEAVNRHRVNQLAAAEALYRAIIAIQPGHASAAYNLGLILQTAGRLEEAKNAYRHAIAIRPDYVDAYSNLGTALHDSGKSEEAVAIFHQALALNPSFPMAYCNMGVALKELGRYDEAVAAYKQAIALKPDYDWAYCNMSAVLLDMNKPEESVLACRQAVTINPGMSMAWFNMATAYKHMNLLDEAVGAFRQSVTVNPEFVEGHFSLGQTLLTQGKLEEGWPEYEWRWRLRDYGWLKNIHGEFVQPRWEGENIAGRTILIYCEQGLGDAIQYVRYIPMVQALGAKVVLMCHPPLKRLMSQLKDVQVIALDEKPLPPFDVHSPLLSLPRIFKTGLDTVPANVPYLHAEAAEKERWGARIGNDGELKVGIVWAGNPGQRGDKLRSPRLAAMQPLFYIPGVKFVALQMGPGRQDLAQHPLPANVLDLGGEIKDMADTAGIMSNLDLVITSCTAPLHMAGALGVPTWAVIPFAPHFLWMLNRDDSPWYPSLKLYRQDQAGTEWNSVVGRMAADLAKMAVDRR